MLNTAEVSLQGSVEDQQSGPIAKSIDANELYIICTQSNEYLLLVDARSEEEYLEGHIASSLSLVG